tara:strand:+ start:230 stop:352 length:123 start_codon:yes stop_codon:yes gene_type:complete
VLEVKLPPVELELEPPLQHKSMLELKKNQELQMKIKHREL